jgi:outer membrane protein assembly factor BamB
VALVEANPKELVELGSIQALTDKTWNNLCLYGHKLLVRNAREAACYELP